MNVITDKDRLMELTIDGESVAIDAKGISTLRDLVVHIELNLVKPPRVITRMVLNGEELDEAQEIGLGGFSIEEIETLSVETADKQELAYQALDDAQEYLPQLSALLEQSAKMIREGDTAQGLTLASEALDVISAFGDVLEGIRATFRLDFAEVKIDEFNMLDKLKDLGKLAQEILKAAQDENWTLFADLTEYELSPLLYEWMAVIPSLVAMLPSQDNSEADSG